MTIEGVPAWGVGAVGDVICGTQEFPIGGKWFVFGFELDWHCCDLFFSEFFVRVDIRVEGTVSLCLKDGCVVEAYDLSSNVHGLVIVFFSRGFCWGALEMVNFSFFAGLLLFQ